jgi:uncharacterized protein YndB with AHSA1/START domain
MARTSPRTEANPQPVLTDTSLLMRRRLPAAREDVFRAWTQPDIIRQWFCPAGFSVVESQVDLRQGGRFRLGMKSPEGQVSTTSGVYQEIQPPERLVYTWRWDDPDALETRVTVEFLDLGMETEVVLRHERFADAKRRDAHLGGWNGCLQNLDTYFAARPRA